MKTVSEITTWLKSVYSNKCVLVDITEISGAPSANLYFSSRPYTDNGIVYLPIIESGLNFSESLDISGAVSSSFGTIELVNTSGIYDSYLLYTWKRRPIKIYLGDQSWTKSDFILIFDGLVEDISANNENTLSLSLFDKLQKLNDELYSTTLKSTNYSQNSLDTLLPVTLGEVFNISPLLVDNGTSEWAGAVYMVHNGTILDIIEVRENGVPIEITKNLNNGTFTLVNKPVGTITCSVQGATPYTNTVPGIISYIVKNYGSEFNRLTTGDIDFSDFSNTSKVGVYYSDRVNILEACAELANSVNSCLTYSTISVSNDTVSDGKLRLIELKVPSGNPKYTLTDSDMLEGTLSINQIFPVKPSIKLAYCKNYTIQQTVAQALNPASDFDKEYLYASVYSPSKQSLYRDNGTVLEEKTYLITTAEAEIEATKRLTLWQDQRVVITAKYLPSLIFVQLGDIVQLQSTRFNLSQGKLGIVFSINRDWITGYVEIGVLV